MKPIKYILLLISATSMWTLTSCDYNTSYIEGNKNRTTEIRDLDEFENIDITGNFNISLVQDSNHKAILECSSNIQDYIMSEVQGNTLYISVPENVLIKEDKMVDLSIHFSSLTNVITKGKAKIKSKETIECDNLNIECIGSSNLNVQIKANKLAFNLPGASKIILNGEVKNIDITSAGALQYDGYDCNVDSYHITMNGVGNAKVNALESLNVQINGAGNVYYKGAPNKVISNIGGIGRVKRAE